MTWLSLFRGLRWGEDSLAAMRGSFGLSQESIVEGPGKMDKGGGRKLLGKVSRPFP